MAAGDANCRLPRGASLAAGCVRQRDAGGRVRRQRPLAKVLGDTECPSLSHAMTAAGRVRLGRCERRCCGRDCARGSQRVGPTHPSVSGPPGSGAARAPPCCRARGPRVSPREQPRWAPHLRLDGAPSLPRGLLSASACPERWGAELSRPGTPSSPPSGALRDTGAPPPAEPHPDVALRSRGHVWGARPVRTRSRALHAPLT